MLAELVSPNPEFVILKVVVQLVSVLEFGHMAVVVRAKVLPVIVTLFEDRRELLPHAPLSTIK